MMTGSAPIAGDVLDFLKVCFCCDILEGYGLSETGAGGTATMPGDPMAGIVGGPSPCVKIRLRDIPEMDYYHTDRVPRGEVCIAGSCIFDGYFRNPEKTAEALNDGWVHTGDVAAVLSNGAVKIFDRVKNLFKLS